MFGFGRQKTHGEIVRSELGESLGHFAQAASHAAAGVSSTVGPRVNAARGYLSPAAAKFRDTASNGWESTMTAFGPLAAAAMDSARRNTATEKVRSRGMRNMKAMRLANMPGIPMRGRRSRRRWPRIASLLATGAAMGAVGAMAMRRRRQQQWEEFEAGRVMSAPEGMEPAIGTAPAEAMLAAPGSAAASAMDKMATPPAGTRLPTSPIIDKNAG